MPKKLDKKSKLDDSALARLNVLIVIMVIFAGVVFTATTFASDELDERRTDAEGNSGNKDALVCNPSLSIKTDLIEGERTVPIHTHITWWIRITVGVDNGTGSNIVVKDSFPAEIGIIEYNKITGTATLSSPGIGNMQSTHLEWGIETLPEGKNETLDLHLETVQNPNGFYEFTTAGEYNLDEGAEATCDQNCTASAPPITVEAVEGGNANDTTPIPPEEDFYPGIVRTKEVEINGTDESGDTLTTAAELPPPDNKAEIIDRDYGEDGSITVTLGSTDTNIPVEAEVPIFAIYSWATREISVMFAWDTVLFTERFSEVSIDFVERASQDILATLYFNIHSENNPSKISMAVPPASPGEKILVDAYLKYTLLLNATGITQITLIESFDPIDVCPPETDYYDENATVNRPDTKRFIFEGGNYGMGNTYPTCEYSITDPYVNEVESIYGKGSKDIDIHLKQSTLTEMNWTYIFAVRVVGDQIIDFQTFRYDQEGYAFLLDLKLQARYANGTVVSEQALFEDGQMVSTSWILNCNDHVDIYMQTSSWVDGDGSWNFTMREGRFDPDLTT